MLNKKIPIIDGLRIDEAHKGGGKGDPSKSQAQIEAEQAQAQELATLQKKEQSRVEALGRSRRGRASLLSGTETGSFVNNMLKQSLGS